MNKQLKVEAWDLGPPLLQEGLPMPTLSSLDKIIIASGENYRHREVDLKRELPTLHPEGTKDRPQADTKSGPEHMCPALGRQVMWPAQLPVLALTTLVMGRGLL